MSKHVKEWTLERSSYDETHRFCRWGDWGHKIPRHRKTGPAK